MAAQHCNQSPLRVPGVGQPILQTDEFTVIYKLLTLRRLYMTIHYIKEQSNCNECSSHVCSQNMLDPYQFI